MSRVTGPAGPVDLPGLPEVTPIVLTLNEVPNLARCLDRLRWARRVIVLDSGSSDGTLDVAGEYPNVTVHARSFDDHAAQWNHALSLAETPWVLTLDADYLVPDDFVVEARQFLARAEQGSAALAIFRYCVLGRPLRASLYPPRPVLFQPACHHYEMDGHTQRLQGIGKSVTLATPFDHDDRKAFAHWLAAQRRYAVLEAAKLSSRPAARSEDRVRKAIVLAPPAAFAKALFVKGTALDGWPGWYYAFQRGVAELVLSAELVKRGFRRP